MSRTFLGISIGARCSLARAGTRAVDWGCLPPLEPSCTPQFLDSGAGRQVLLSEGRHQNGDPGENRTLNIQLRRLTLYPIELRGRSSILTKNHSGSAQFDDLASKQRAREVESPRAPYSSLICLNFLDSYFAENRNTVSEWKTVFGFNRVLGKLG
jgi:hypothetical protein